MAFDSQPCDGKLEILHYKRRLESNAPLSRASFDLTPFCSINYGGVKPPTNYASTCNVPAKSGYHVILAVWEVADTANAFYNVIDVDFGGGGTPNPGVPAPTGLTSPAQTNNSVSLAWAASTGASSYEIYRDGSLCRYFHYNLLYQYGVSRRNVLYVYCGRRKQYGKNHPHPLRLPYQHPEAQRPIRHGAQQPCI